ncbi:MAG: hypothetical protein ACE15F_02065 [bacterium]
MKHNASSLARFLIIPLCVSVFSACGSLPRKTKESASSIPTAEFPQPDNTITQPEKEAEHPMPFPPVPPAPQTAETVKPATDQLSSPRSVSSQPAESPAAPPGVITPPDLGRRPPALIYSDDLGLYWSPSATYDIYFQNGFWYVRSDNHWFRSRGHRGPWELIQPFQLPESLR